MGYEDEDVEVEGEEEEEGAKDWRAFSKVSRSKSRGISLTW